jgi:hypothetical protein
VREGNVGRDEPFAAALPSDVRKASGFPINPTHFSEAMPRDSFGGVASKNRIGRRGKAEPFRTSGGKAANKVCTRKKPARPPDWAAPQKLAVRF